MKVHDEWENEEARDEPDDARRGWEGEEAVDERTPHAQEEEDGQRPRQEPHSDCRRKPLDEEWAASL